MPEGGSVTIAGKVAAVPHGFVVDPATTALLVIDMQGDFLEPDGWAAASGLDIAMCRAIVPVLAELATAARSAGLPILYTRENYRPDLADCPARKLARGTPPVGTAGPAGRYLIQGEPCNDIVPALAPMPGDIVIDKPGAGAFHATLLDQILRLRGITQLIITGVTADVCVKTTLHEANDRGYECLLIEDGVASYNPDFTDAVVAMARGGVTGSTATTQALLAALATLPR